MEKVFLISGSRTAVGSFGGSLKRVPAIDLGATVISDVLKKKNIRPMLSELMEKVDRKNSKIKDRSQLKLKQTVGTVLSQNLPLTK